MRRHLRDRGEDDGCGAIDFPRTPLSTPSPLCFIPICGVLTDESAYDSSETMATEFTEDDAPHDEDADYDDCDDCDESYDDCDDDYGEPPPHQPVSASPALREITQVGGGQEPEVVKLANGHFGCSLCSNTYSRKGVLVRHFVKHRIGGIFCPFNSECGNDRRLFNRWDHFRNHCVANHPGLSMLDPTVRKVYRDYLKRGERIDEGKMKF